MSTRSKAKVVSIDFETSSACDLSKSGAYVYSLHDTTEVLCLAYSIDHGPIQLWHPGLEPPADLFKAIQDRARIQAHNATFEEWIWFNQCVAKLGWPEVLDWQWDCTMAACAYRALPLKLEKAAQVMLGEAYQKDMKGHRVMKQLANKNRKDNAAALKKPEKLAILYEYCKQDVKVEMALRDAVGDLSAAERGVYLLDQRINRRGVPLDQELIKKAQKLLAREQERLDAEMVEATNGVIKSGTDINGLTAWVNEQGITMVDGQADTITAMLKYQDLPAYVVTALRCRQQVGKASVKKVPAMVACMGPDGLARYLLQYYGATTGRWSGRIIQPQNFPRPTTKLDIHTVVQLIMDEDFDLMEDLCGSVTNAISEALKGFFKAPDGYVLGFSDFSGIETVVLFCLAGQDDMVEFLAAGGDAYCDLASVIFGHEVTKKEHPELRQCGKIGVLGLGYQMGGPTLYANGVEQDAPKNLWTMDLAEETKTGYRQRYTMVPKLWYGLQDAAIKAVQNPGTTYTYRDIAYRMQGDCLVCRLPSGRLLFYRNPKITMEPMPWDEDDVRPCLKYYMYRKGHWVRIDGYGGLLTENVVQAVARDIMVAAMFRADDRGWPIIFTVHDELVLLLLRSLGITKEMITELMEEREHWFSHYPIRAETDIDVRYHK